MAYKVALNYFTGELQLVNSSTSGSGNVTGIAPTTINAISRWADTTATTIKNSPNTLIQDSGAIEAQAFISMRDITGLVTINADETWIAPAIELSAGGAIVIASNAQIIIV